MKKTIYGIFSSVRVKGSNEPFSNREILYCEEDKGAALEVVKKFNEEQEENPYLEWRYECQELTLFTN